MKEGENGQVDICAVEMLINDNCAVFAETIFVRKSAGSMDVRACFSKYGL